MVGGREPGEHATMARSGDVGVGVDRRPLIPVSHVVAPVETAGGVSGGREATRRKGQ